MCIIYKSVESCRVNYIFPNHLYMFRYILLDANEIFDFCDVEMIKYILKYLFTKKYTRGIRCTIE